MPLKITQIEKEEILGLRGNSLALVCMLLMTKK